MIQHKGEEIAKEELQSTKSHESRNSNNVKVTTHINLRPRKKINYRYLSTLKENSSSDSWSCDDKAYKRRYSQKRLKGKYNLNPSKLKNIKELKAYQIESLLGWEKEVAKYALESECKVIHKPKLIEVEFENYCDRIDGLLINFPFEKYLFDDFVNINS